MAVKPNDVAETCRSLTATSSPPERVLSIAAGVTTGVIEDALGVAGVAVVRAMPNTPALVGAGVSAIAAGSAASATDLDWAESVLSAVGTVVRVAESQLDAVTGLSGSGPAYVFHLAEGLIAAGIAEPTCTRGSRSAGSAATRMSTTSPPSSAPSAAASSTTSSRPSCSARSGTTATRSPASR